MNAARDPWFWSHYETAAGFVRSLVPPECLEASRHVVDFGCGDGATTLGVASPSKAHVTGVDLYLTFQHLRETAERNLGSGALPANLSFVQTKADEPLPFAAESIDLVYSWSVFEHVADVKGALERSAQVTKPGGYLFIQIEPLFHGPFGSHLRRLVKEPWAHLAHDEEAFLAMAAAARDDVPEAERDRLYRDHEFEQTKRHLIDEYRKLNRITAPQLVANVIEAGYEIAWQRVIDPDEGLVPGPQLLQRWPRDLLMANQVVLLARRQSSSKESRTSR